MGLIAGNPSAQKGKIDLTNFDFNADPSIKLNGYWEFYEGALIKTYPNQLSSEPTLIEVPDNWNKYASGKNIKHGMGYASYRVLIQKRKSDKLSLLINDIGSSYKVWINNTLRLTAGRLDTLEENYLPTYGKHTVELKADTEYVELIIEVANFSQVKGGIKTYVSLIETSKVETFQERESFRIYFCLGIIIMFGLYHIALFLFNMKDKASLNFGLFCVVMFIFLIFRSRIIYHFYNDIGWNLSNRIEYISQYLSLPLFYLFFSGSFPRQFAKLFKQTSWVISLLLIVFVLFTDMKQFSATLLIFHVVILVYIVLVIIGIIRALVQKEEGIKIIFPGFVVFMLSLINDILHVQNVINTANLVIFGIVGFMISQALFLALKSVRNTIQVTKLSEYLKRLNKVLGYYVPDDFLKLLKKNSIIEVGLGNCIEKEMTIMFSDIRAFTSISEGLSPSQAFDFINDYFKCMAPIIRQHNGFIDKYLGDGIMALFPNSADDAMLAGKAMLEELQRFNLKNQQKGMPQIEIGIGLHTGYCVLGTVGEPQRMDTTVISDAVNLAARIEALTKFYKTAFIISQETHDRINSDLRKHMRFIGEAKVKGKTITTSLYKVFLDHYYDIELLNKFDAAIFAFYNKQFAQASAIFNELAATSLNDGIIEFYIRLSEKYKNQELPENWKIFQTFEY